MNEYMPIPIQDISYEKYVWELLERINRRDIRYDIIGSELSERTGIEYPIYRFSINEGAPGRICVISGVHGNEIAGPLSLLSLFDQVHFDQLPGCFHYLIYPLVNPTGFDLRQRYDDDGRDLNAVFKTTLESDNYEENQAIIADAANYLPFDAVVTLHEDSDSEHFYMYGLGRHNVPFYHEICRRAITLCPPWCNADIYGCQSDDFGLVLASARDYAFDGYFYAKEYTPIACTIETPGRREIDFRTHMMVDLLLFFVKQLARPPHRR